MSMNFTYSWEPRQAWQSDYRKSLRDAQSVLRTLEAESKGRDLPWRDRASQGWEWEWQRRCGVNQIADLLREREEAGNYEEAADMAAREMLATVIPQLEGDDADGSYDCPISEIAQSYTPSRDSHLLIWALESWHEFSEHYYPFVEGASSPTEAIRPAIQSAIMTFLEAVLDGWDGNGDNLYASDMRNWYYQEYLPAQSEGGAQ